MGDKSEIQWTDATWNPVTGCSKVSPGCAHCYAESLTRRFAKTWGVPDLPWTPGNAVRNVILHPERLSQPSQWRRPRMVFVNSMSDLFHEQVPDGFIARVFAEMADEQHHIFQVLTKRPERMAALLADDRFVLDVARNVSPFTLLPIEWPLPNVWLGTSIENRRFIYRADVLRETPAAVRFISAEPLLGPLTFDSTQTEYDGWGRDKQMAEPSWFDGYEGSPLDLIGIDWLIVGGESGVGHRPIRAEWVRDLRDAADLTGTAFFFKQWGGRTPKSGGRELDGRTWEEFPERLSACVR